MNLHQLGWDEDYNREFERYAEDYLEETFTSYVFTPVVTVAVGYRFF